MITHLVYLRAKKIYMNYPLEPFQIRGYRLKGYLFSSEILSILFSDSTNSKTFLERVLKGINKFGFGEESLQKMDKFYT